MLKIFAFSLALAATALLPSAWAADGDIRGVTRSSTGEPLPEVQVTVHSVEEKKDWSVVCDRSGAFAVEKLKPGTYEITARKEGFITPIAAIVEVASERQLISKYHSPRTPRLRQMSAAPHRAVSSSDWQKRTSMTGTAPRIAGPIRRIAAIRRRRAIRPILLRCGHTGARP